MTHDTITNSIVVSLDGVIQKNGTDFTVNNLVLTFTTNVTSGVAIQVVYLGLTASVGSVANDAITTAKIADGAVTAAKIADGTVVAAEIADDAIITAKILNSNVTTAKIADNAITGAKIAMTSDARGDILYYNGTDYARLAKGSSGTVLKMGANDPAWGTDSAVDLTADQSWTGSQRATMVTDNDGSFDMNAGQNFNCTPSGNFALTFTNIANGQSGFIILINSGGHTVTLHSNSKADANLPTTVSTAGTYILNYISNGTNAYLTNSAVIA